ncbi:52 kDa repressor of the inhibitor of the protein kinase-like [Metopolophium dirhodum]|uniref:52 kDa repressor of the inhibitor of the protein kinase-like n=1 Tax=Metopolophium dirhodum TaxID=44670 RepID=UPI00298F8BA2|nr:52 kDa repressor of the inhibitor of the protein kinase-like [Metopolophium dirhodum]
MSAFVMVLLSLKEKLTYPLSNDKNEVEPETYFRITICIPFIDAFIQQLEDRFLEHRNVFNGFQCLFSYDSDDTLVEFDELVKFYFPDSDIDTVRAELQMWNVKLKRLNIQPKTGLDALKYCSELIYPNLSKLFRIFCTLPVSTATPERMFSCLKRLKTYLRNTMKEERLNGLTLMAVHRNIPISAEEVIDELTKKKRKLNFVL